MFHMLKAKLLKRAARKAYFQKWQISKKFKFLIHYPQSFLPSLRLSSSPCHMQKLVKVTKFQEILIYTSLEDVKPWLTDTEF